MPKYYSQDMRVAALECVERGESRQDIIKFFGISLKTLSNWVQLHRNNQDLKPNKRGCYSESNNLDNLLSQMVLDNPDFTLDEFSELIPQHRTTIFYHLKKMGITRKKNHAIRRKK